MWLRDLLPVDLPDCRVLTYEYDSKWLEDPVHVSLRDCARGLLSSVARDRTHRGGDKICKTMVCSYLSSLVSYTGSAERLLGKETYYLYRP